MSEGMPPAPPPPSSPPPGQPGPVGPAGPAPRRRPGTVTVANLLLVVVAAAGLVYLIASVTALSGMQAAFEEAFAGTDAEDFAGVSAAGTLISGVVYLLLGLTLVILAIFNGQGRNGARITTWVIGGLGLCCGGASLISAAIPDISMPDDPNAPDAAEMEEILSAHVADWFWVVTLTANVVGVLAVAAALLLLALPPSNEFFRKPAEPFVPPPGYPPVG